MDKTMWVNMQVSVSAFPAAWKEFCDRNLTEGNHSVSAAIKDATSCCSEEADPSAALGSAQDFLCMGGQV